MTTAIRVAVWAVLTPILGFWVTAFLAWVPPDGPNFWKAFWDTAPYVGGLALTVWAIAGAVIVYEAAPQIAGRLTRRKFARYERQRQEEARQAALLKEAGLDL